MVHQAGIVWRGLTRRAGLRKRFPKTDIDATPMIDNGDFKYDPNGDERAPDQAVRVGPASVKKSDVVRARLIAQSGFKDVRERIEIEPCGNGRAKDDETGGPVARPPAKLRCEARVGFAGIMFHVEPGQQNEIKDGEFRCNPEQASGFDHEVAGPEPVGE